MKRQQTRGPVRSQSDLDGPTATGFRYLDTGGDGPVVVLLHGVLMNGTLWDDVVAGLQDRYRCIVPELPFGAHRVPMPDDADLTLESIATMIARFLAKIDVHDVTLVSNDWGGAQLVLSPGGSDRVANLVLVSCEAFDNYPPGLPGRLLCLLAALPGGLPWGRQRTGGPMETPDEPRHRRQGVRPGRPCGLLRPDVELCGGHPLPVGPTRALGPGVRCGGPDGGSRVGVWRGCGIP